VTDAADGPGGAAPDAAPEVPVALRRAVDRWLRHVEVERGLSRNTIQAYRRDLARYAAHLAAEGVVDPADARPAHVAGFAQRVRDPEHGGLTASSLARMLSSVRSFHRFLVEEGIVDVDVSAEQKPPKLPSRLPKAVSVETMGRILDATDGDEPLRVRDKALLELLYATGARVSEITALTVDDVLGPDGAAAEIVRVLGKGGKQRIVPVGSFARRAVDAYLVRVRPVLAARGTATPALFLGLRGHALSRQNAWLVIKAAAERAGVTEEISPHTFRHSFATHLIAGGADVRVVQELLGHSSVATTQIYTRVTVDTLRDVYTTAHPRARRA
jgi:integrase/recombinase XerD